MIAECLCLLLWYPGIEIMCIYKYGSVVSLSFSSLLMFLRAYFRDSRIVVYMVRGWHSVCGCNSVSPQAMSFEAHSLTVPSVMWLGLLPSDLQRFGPNLPYFLHPPAPNWNDYIPGNCLFWFLLLLPCFFSLHWASSEAILIFKYKLWLWRFYDVCLIVVYTGLLLCLLLNILYTQLLLSVGEINVACSRLRVPQNVLLPLTRRDECKLASLLKRPYLTRQPEWRREVRENNNQLCHLFTFVKNL